MFSQLAIGYYVVMVLHHIFQAWDCGGGWQDLSPYISCQGTTNHDGGPLYSTIAMGVHYIVQ
jgi:hypothetical protein